MRILVALLCGAVVLSPRAAWAGDETSALPPPPEPVPEEVAQPGPGSPAPAVGIVQGRRVNLRVGPRIDNEPVTQLDEGEVLVIVERVPGWLGVRVPAGFQAAVSARYVEPVGLESVRVVADRVNVRVRPWPTGQAEPGAFRDHPERGTLLPVIRREGDWFWVLAPETIRAYISDRYVKELATPTARTAVLDVAHATRAERVRSLARARRAAAGEIAADKLRAAMGQAQQVLYRLRVEGGSEWPPLVTLLANLDRALETHTDASASTRQVARALRADIDRELELRVARRRAADAERPAPEEAPLAPTRDAVDLRGVVRWEPAPGWRNRGAHILWIDDAPVCVLRLTIGTMGPPPDLEAADRDGQVRTVHGREPGERVFGLPVVEVLSLAR